MHRFANPARFMRIADRIQPVLAICLSICLCYGLVQAIYISPPDYQQGDSVRIMYVHVPAAMLSMSVYTLMAIASACFLIWRHPLADIAARASAPLGAWFTVMTLVTGSLWGKPMWGAWWVWDARLTSELILLFLYIGYIALSNSVSTDERGRKICAIMALIGFVNIPIIHFSVEWWNTLHQPSSFIRPGGIAIDPSMQVPLFAMLMSFTLLYVTLLIIRMNTALMEQKIRRLQLS